MAISCLNRYKSRKLQDQIREAEQQLLKRQRRVDTCTTKLILNIHQQLTASSTLLLAGGSGFVLGELTKEQTPPCIGTAESSPLRTVLTLVTFMRTVYMALPATWMKKSDNQLISK